MANLFDGRVIDSAKVLLPNGLVLAALHLADLKTIAELGLIALSAGYTIWRWWRDAKKQPKDSK